MCRLAHLLFAYWVFFQIFVVCDFFSNQPFLKITSGIPSECQTVLIQIRLDVLSGLIWVQTVCKCYQQTTLVDTGLRVRTQRVATSEPCCQTICFSARVTREVRRHFRDIRVPLILSMRNASNMFILNTLLIRTSSLRIYWDINCGISDSRVKAIKRICV